jgi:hypothetical protein
MTKAHLPHLLPQRFILNIADPNVLIDPRWLRGRGRREQAVVDTTGTIRIDGVLLVFDLEKGSTQQPSGTEVLVSFGFPQIYCELVADVQMYRDYMEQRDAEAAAKVRLDRNCKRDEAVAFNEKIKLPVSWTTGIKMVLSGLSERSAGDGTSNRTVQHILLHSNLTHGKLKRRKGDFLCTTDRGKLGTHWDGSPDLRVDGDGKLYPAKVTCAICLRRAALIMAKSVE